MKNIEFQILTAALLVLLFSCFNGAYRIDLPSKFYYLIILNALQLLVVLYLCIKATLIAKKNKEKKGSSLLQIVNFLGIYLAFFSSNLFLFAYGLYMFTENDWAINIGGKLEDGLVIFDYKLILIVLIPITSLLISKLVWNKNKPSRF